jgi:hypothetical protein
LDLNEEFHLESSNCDPGIELRLRRDREREDLRKMIAQKRKEKNLRSKNKEAVEIAAEGSRPLAQDGDSCDETTSPAAKTDLPKSGPISNPDESFSKSSFFMYSQDDININRRTIQSSSSTSALADTNSPAEPLHPSPQESDDEKKIAASDVVADSPFGEDSLPDLAEEKIESDPYDPRLTLVSDDESEDLEYDNLIQAMKQVIENSDQAGDCDDDEFEEEDDAELEDIDEGDDDSSEESPQSCPAEDDFSEIDPQHLSPDEILSLADQLFSEVPRPTSEAYDHEDELSNGSWDEFSDTESPDVPAPDNPGLTVFGVPFPLGKTVCEDNGLSPELSTPASRMEALREYLENALGTDRFIKVYRLLKSVGPKDDDDELLSALERVVGVEGLRYMDAFFQLIHIEDKFESGEW